MESQLTQQLQQLSVDTTSLAVPSPLHSSTPCSASLTDGSVLGSSFTAASSPLPSDDEAHLACCEVRDTPDKGQALFSTRRIRPGTLILVEEPLIALSKELEESYEAIEGALSKLSKRERKTYLSLFDAKKSRMSAVVSIYYSNCYSTEPFVTKPEPDRPKAWRDCEGGSCIGALASRINHSCIPNVSFSYMPPSEAHPRGQMRFYAIKAISRGKELLSNYDKNIFEASSRRQQKYRLHYGFACTCEACAPPSEFWVKSDERRRAMKEIVSETKGLEKRWQKEAEGKREGPDVANVCQDAVAALLRLESLLVKEGLTATPLANVYKSLVKWSRRAGQDATSWLEKELDVSTLVFGRRGVRTLALRDAIDGRVNSL